MRSELIDERHLARRAIIYIRQSSLHQVLTNQESLRLQYDLRRRALDLGWREEDVEVIDTDLGLSGAAATHRKGFKDLLARVTLGEVGIVFSSDVTRLSRNCSDWYPLLICAAIVRPSSATATASMILAPRTAGFFSASRARSPRWSCIPFARVSPLAC